VIFVTFPLHEAVKQNNAYMTSKLLLFGADPTLRDTWGRTAYDYAKGKATHDQILKARRIRQPLEHRKPGEWD
jgi:ankyrin repeat protein